MSHAPLRPHAPLPIPWIYMMRPGLGCFANGNHITITLPEQIAPHLPPKNCPRFSVVRSGKQDECRSSIHLPTAYRFHCIKYVIFGGQENEGGDMLPATPPNLKRSVGLNHVDAHAYRFFKTIARCHPTRRPHHLHLVHQ